MLVTIAATSVRNTVTSVLLIGNSPLNKRADLRQANAVSPDFGRWIKQRALTDYASVQQLWAKSTIFLIGRCDSPQSSIGLLVTMTWQVSFFVSRESARRHITSVHCNTFLESEGRIVKAYNSAIHLIVLQPSEFNVLRRGDAYVESLSPVNW